MLRFIAEVCNHEDLVKLFVQWISTKNKQMLISNFYELAIIEVGEGIEVEKVDFADEVAAPLGLDFWIGLPESEEARVSMLAAAPPPSARSPRHRAECRAPRFWRSRRR